MFPSKLFSKDLKEQFRRVSFACIFFFLSFHLNKCKTFPRFWQAPVKQVLWTISLSADEPGILSQPFHLGKPVPKPTDAAAKWLPPEEKSSGSFL